jgi:hypothetical protein
MGPFGAWFLSLQAALFGLIVEFGAGYLFPPLLIAAAIAFRRIDKDKRPKTYPLLIALPAVSALALVWAAIFYFDPASGRPANPEWVGMTLLFTPWLVLLFGAVFIVSLRRVRLFALLYSVVNLYAAVVVCFVALMAVTGSWL